MRLTICVGSCAIGLLLLSSACQQINTGQIKDSSKTDSALNAPVNHESPNKNDLMGVSLIQLLANPKEFQGQRVNFVAYARVEFEGSAVYLNQDDEKYGIYKNALWLSIPKEDIVGKYKNFDRKILVIEGTFNPDVKGHFGYFSGSIENITRIQVWGSVKDRR